MYQCLIVLCFQFMKVFHSLVGAGDYIDVMLNSSPALFEPYLNNPQPAVDEWTLSQAMAADSTNGGLKQLEDHYSTFIVRLDCTIDLHQLIPLRRQRKILPR